MNSYVPVCAMVNRLIISPHWGMVIPESYMSYHQSEHWETMPKSRNFTFRFPWMGPTFDFSGDFQGISSGCPSHVGWPWPSQGGAGLGNHLAEPRGADASPLVRPWPRAAPAAPCPGARLQCQWMLAAFYMFLLVLLVFASGIRRFPVSIFLSSMGQRDKALLRQECVGMPNFVSASCRFVQIACSCFAVPTRIAVQRWILAGDFKVYPNDMIYTWDLRWDEMWSIWYI